MLDGHADRRERQLVGNLVVGRGPALRDARGLISPQAHVVAPRLVPTRAHERADALDLENLRAPALRDVRQRVLALNRCLEGLPVARCRLVRDLAEVTHPAAPVVLEERDRHAPELATLPNEVERAGVLLPGVGEDHMHVGRQTPTVRCEQKPQHERRRAAAAEADARGAGDLELAQRELHRHARRCNRRGLRCCGGDRGEAEEAELHRGGLRGAHAASIASIPWATSRATSPRAPSHGQVSSRARALAARTSASPARSAGVRCSSVGRWPTGCGGNSHA